VAAEPTPESVVRAAAAVHAQADSCATLAEIVRQARRCLPEFEHVSVSRIHPDDTLETLVAGTDLARSFDQVQSSVRQGPCIEATDDDLVVVRDARHEQRWPAYISQATKLGLLSQIGVRLRSDAHGIICLNLHPTTHTDIDAGSVGVAEHLGVHAGLALGHVLKAEQLNTAIGTRTVIGAAVGIMMERYGLTPGSRVQLPAATGQHRESQGPVDRQRRRRRGGGRSEPPLGHGLTISRRDAPTIGSDRLHGQWPWTLTSGEH
jgi:hypothetical protein